MQFCIQYDGYNLEKVNPSVEKCRPKEKTFNEEKSFYCINTVTTAKNQQILHF